MWGVLWRTIFSHTPDEAKSGGLVKACVQEKKLFCSREIEFFMEFSFLSLGGCLSSLLPSLLSFLHPPGTPYPSLLGVLDIFLPLEM